MKMHGCVFGLEHFGHGPHGPKRFGHKHGHHGHHGPMHGHHGPKHFGHKHGHHGHRGPMHGHHGPKHFGHKHGHHGHNGPMHSPHGFGMGTSPDFPFKSHGDHAVKTGPEFGGPKSSPFARGMFDRFIDENGFEWRLHLSEESGGDTSKSSEDESGNDKERSGCRRWGKHGRHGPHHRRFERLAKRLVMRKGKGCKCKCTCERKGEGENAQDAAAPAESGPQIQEAQEPERPSTV